MDQNINSGFTSLRKIFVPLIPIFGTIFDEVFFEYGSRIKQNRLNQFTLLLVDYFEKKDVDVESLKTEEFVDLFDSIIRRVVRTKSEDKLKRYKNILIHQIENPSHSDDLQETFLDLIEQLSEKELVILNFHDIYGTQEFQINKLINQKQADIKMREGQLERWKQGGFRENVDDIQGDLIRFKATLTSLQETKAKIIDYRNPSTYGVKKSLFLFYKQNLAAKGLIIDIGVGYIAETEHQPFDTVRITDFGRMFLDFIKSEK